jgi:CHASE3 domain sensor protein
MRLSIFWRLTSGYAIILSLFVGISSYSIIQLGRLSSTARDALDMDSRMIGYQEKLTDIFLSEVRYAGKFIITHTGSLYEQFLQFKTDFVRYMGESQLLAATPDVKAGLSRVERLHLQYQDLFDQEVRYVKAGQPYAESRFQQEKEKILESALGELDRLKRQVQKNLHAKLETMERVGRVARTIAELTTLVLFGLSVVLSFVISKSITTPLSKLTRVTMDETEETLNSASDLARIPEIQELCDALHNSKRKLQKAAEMNAHFVDTVNEQFTVPLISLQKRLNYLNATLAEKITADQKITLDVVAGETKRLIQRCTELHPVPALPFLDSSTEEAPPYVWDPVPSKYPLRMNFEGVYLLLLAQTKTVASRVANRCAVLWNTIFHSIKTLASGKARKQ